MKKPITLVLVKRILFIALLFLFIIITNPCWAQVIPIPIPEKIGCYTSGGAYQPCGSSWTDHYNGVEYNCRCDCSSPSAQDCFPIAGPNNNNSGQGSISYLLNPGDVSINGLTQGNPFFTAHQSQSFEDWATEYKQLLASYGITSILDKNFTIPKVPLSGNNNLNAIYISKSADFKPTTAPAVKPDTEFPAVTVPIMGGSPLTQAERERQALLVNKFGKQYIDMMTYVRPETGMIESTPPVADLSDSKEYKTAEAFFDKIGEHPLGVLPSYTGKLLLSTVNESDKLIRDITINGKYSDEEIVTMNPVKVILNNVVIEQVTTRVTETLGNLAEKTGVAFMSKKYGEARKEGTELAIKLGKDAQTTIEAWTAKRH